jgi:hypothetical protein
MPSGTEVDVVFRVIGECRIRKLAVSVLAVFDSFSTVASPNGAF